MSILQARRPGKHGTHHVIAPAGGVRHGGSAVVGVHHVVTASGGMRHGSGNDATIGLLIVQPSGGVGYGGSAEVAVVRATPPAPPMPGSLITQGFWIAT